MYFNSERMSDSVCEKKIDPKRYLDMTHNCRILAWTISTESRQAFRERIERKRNSASRKQAYNMCTK